MNARTLMVGLVLATLPTAASAQDPDDVRIGGHFVAAFAGDIETNVGDTELSASLDPTLGFGARVDAPIHDYVAVGGLFELSWFEWDGAGTEREPVFDIDVYVRVRYVVEASRDVWIEPYVAVPFGLSLALYPIGGDEEVWPGFNTGVLGGAWLVLRAIPVSFYAELGWRHHQVFQETPVFGVDVDLKAVTNQLATHFGVAFVL